MAKAMTKHDDITPEDRALIVGVQERDLPPAPPKLIQLLQPNSMKLLEQIPDAKAGDFAVPHDGEYLLFRGATGVPFIPIGFAQAFVEWGQGRSGYVDSHPKKPSDAIWRDGRDSPDGKAGYVRENGNRIEDTLYGHHAHSLRWNAVWRNVRLSFNGARRRRRIRKQSGAAQGGGRRPWRPRRRQMADAVACREIWRLSLVHALHRARGQAARGKRADA